MSLLEFNKHVSSLKGKVLVLTGGASGIGEALTHEATKRGAQVVFGDINTELGERVASLSGAAFVKCDVTSYQDVLSLFKEALRKHGRIDHAVANAPEPSPLTVNVNILGSIFFARVATVFLREGASPTDDKSLTFISSAAGVIYAPDTPIYTTTKAGIIGLGSALAAKLPKTHGIRVNVVCPSVTDTPLAAIHVLPFFQQADLPINTATEVAESIMGLASSPDRNGKVLYVEGGKNYALDRAVYARCLSGLGTGL
ncbi:putative 3-hydroxyacyl-CoA dehydrogenase [Leptodontidium sp. MPI-SDFR-AT-0119]|nr:putative 3-hydroxyacyl-CoA dehydrogenase [Leptodontidium sp. MPI-SDFR-AT-0119]